jgi:hypothetical protein
MYYTGTNWDVVLPFFMAYRATPYSTTGYNPFCLLHGLEMVLPNEGYLKAKISPDIQNLDKVQSLENLKSSLIRAYKEVRLNNRKAHQKNKASYDKAKERKFEVNDKVHLFCLLESQAGVISLVRSGKDISLLCRSCLI